MVWMLAEHDETIITEIERQRDRTAAIVAAACLEERLTTLLTKSFELHPSVTNKLFKGLGALATFTSKIDLALLLGIYPPHVHKNLLIIKDIRNEFAHNPKPVTFRSQKIFDLCCNLPKPVRPKAPFKISRKQLEELLENNGSLGVTAFAVTGPVGRDTAPTRYLSSIKLYLFSLYQIEEIARLKRQLRKHEPNERDYWPWPLFGRSEPPPPQPPRIGDRARKKPPHRR